MEELILAMAQEISNLRYWLDEETGEYNEKDYNIDNIIREYEEEFLGSENF